MTDKPKHGVRQKINMKPKLLSHGLSLLAAGAALFSAIASAQAADKKPNILVIWGDDIGLWNISAYSKGMTGYRTPNIDRIAKEGAIFTDWYGQQSCTAGRAAFITGQQGAVGAINRKDPRFAALYTTVPEDAAEARAWEAAGAPLLAYGTLTIGVKAADRDRAVQSLYRAFFE